MSRTAKEKKSSHVPVAEAMSLKKTQGEKLKEIEKLAAVIEDVGKQKINKKREIDWIFYLDCFLCFNDIFSYVLIFPLLVLLRETRHFY